MNWTFNLLFVIIVIAVQKDSFSAAADDNTACGNCPKIYEPVCGTNNVTYSNMCMLENCVGITVDFLMAGECRVPPDNCPHPLYYSQVCGDDGVTYNNKYHMWCSHMTMKHKGRCSN